MGLLKVCEECQRRREKLARMAAIVKERFDAILGTKSEPSEPAPADAVVVEPLEVVEPAASFEEFQEPAAVTNLSDPFDQFHYETHDEQVDDGR